MSPALVLLTALIGSPAHEPEGRLHGRITDARSRSPVSSAAVYVTGDAVSRFTLTTEDGEYDFPDLPAGKYRLRVMHPGFEPVHIEVHLGAGPGIEVDVPLRLQPVRAPPLRVVVDRGTVSTIPDGGDDARLAELGSGRPWLSAGPHSASALSDMVAAQTAARPDPDGREAPHVLYIWGTSTEQGRVLLDGAALGAPLHLGGLLPPVDPEMLSAAEYWSGGASPRFDGGTTHIMEFRTRPVSADGRAWGEVDALAARAGFELPIRSGGILASGRRVNSEFIEWITGRPLGYDYADALARSDLFSSARDRVHATAFATDEAITIPRDQGEDRASWQNLALAAGWTRSGDASSHIGLNYGRATADLPYLRAPAAHVVSIVDRTALTASRRTHGVRTSTTLGLEAEHLHFGRSTSGITSAEVLADSGCRADSTCLDAGVVVLSAFGEVAWQPGPGLRLGGGVRFSYNDAHRAMDVLPRASVTAILDEALALTLSAGRYSRATVLDMGARGASVIPLVEVDGSQSLSPATVVARASHIQLSLIRRTARTAAGASMLLRRHDALPGEDARTVPGVDLWWLHSAGPFDASFGYSYQRRPWGARDSTGVAKDRHVLAANIAHSRGPARIQLSAAWAGGLPFVSLALDDPETAPVLAGTDTPRDGVSGSPEGRYLRIDATATATWRVDWLGSETAITPYVKLINALGRRDALFFFRESGTSQQLHALAAVPLVPTLGIRWSF
ncbi:MAG: carboxypeptidase-like regulatory domain-containing protein [Gemmatimonadetes bacterium]|nr:carboxypeptidase-like regulatory domain-containing protein [Gemmatimonadota bacterium]